MATDEKTAFAERLRVALKRSAKNVGTAAELATQFNLRHRNDPITTQAAQKWLTGKARPTLDKIETLSSWLNVPTHWLCYGPAPESRQRRNATSRQTKLQAKAPTEAEFKLLLKMRQLSEHQLYLVAELVEQLAVEHEMWPDGDQK